MPHRIRVVNGQEKMFTIRDAQEKPPKKDATNSTDKEKGLVFDALGALLSRGQKTRQKFPDDQGTFHVPLGAPFAMDGPCSCVQSVVDADGVAADADPPDRLSKAIAAVKNLETACRNKARALAKAAGNWLPGTDSTQSVASGPERQS